MVKHSLDAEVIDCLRDVLEPEVGLNVVDPGLVHAAIRTPRSVEVEVTLTRRNLSLGEQLIGQIRERLAAAFPRAEHSVHLVWSPRWSPELISDHGIEEIGRRKVWSLF